MVIAQSVKYTTVIHAIRTELRRGSQLGSHEEDNQAHQVPERDAMNGIPAADDVFEVHFKRRGNCELQMTRNHVVQDDDSKRLSEDSRTEVHISHKYEQYREKFIFMLSEF